MDDFDVGEGGLVGGAEVDEFFAAVDEVVIPHVLEGGVDGFDDFGVEGEGEAAPVAGGAEGAELELHVAALLLDEVPNSFVELVAGEIEATLPCCFELFFVDDPGFEAGVIGAGDVPGVRTF